MTVGEFAALTAQQLAYEPNEQQRKVIEALARFCSPAAEARSTVSLDRVFVLNGYAGTGKTSLTAALVRALAGVRIKTVLMAPTGRAAKVFSGYARRAAHTIHRTIYRYGAGDAPGTLRENRDNNTVFIVDEASMIGGQSGQSDLLADLVQYVYAGTSNRLILLGDTAQLPPVGSEFSPAMDRDTLRSLGLTVTYATMTAIARQSRMSGILENATRIRRAMKADPMPEPHITTADDVQMTDTLELPEYIEQAYREDGINETILVTRSNQRARDFNLAIRNQVLYLEERLAKGELILVAKNNYYWARKVKGLDFVANGDVAVVDRVYGTERRYGLEFADVDLTFPDRDDVTLSAKIILDTLVSDTPALPGERLQRLYESIIADPLLFGAGVPYEARQRALYDNPYWNALQVKYAYAVTCHKAQGGQWRNVFVDMTYIAPDAIGLTFYRWLYTAVTRARRRLYIITVPEY